MSVHSGTFKIADLLLKAKANVGYPALSKAKRTGHREAFEEVLRKNRMKVVDNKVALVDIENSKPNGRWNEF